MSSSLPRNRYWGDRKPPKNRKDMFNVTTAPRAAADDASGSVATIRIYGPIDSYGGYWGVSQKEIGEVLDSFGPDITEILVRINSPGGEAWEGLGIMNMFRAHRAKVRGVVDGVAASAASVILVGCDEAVMSPGTQLMIHDASTFAYGNPAELTATLNMIVSLSNSLADVYAEAAGGTAAKWRSLMTAETWYTAKEAVAAKLADSVDVVPDVGTAKTAGDEPEPLFDDVEDQFDLSIYNYAGRSKAPAPAVALDAPAPNPPVVPAPGPHRKEGQLVDLTDEHIATLRAQVGFPENADAATITAALVEALGENADPATEVTLEDAEKILVAAGKKVVSDTIWQDITEKANAGSEAAKQLHAQKRTTDLNKLRNRYPATPEARKRWEDEYDRAPAATIEYLEKSPVIAPTQSIGHGGEGDDAPVAKVQDDPNYQKWSF